ncbi:hypothetical protein [Streptomyces sp. NPDC058623]|uniref:hypothetical protein n=1 Tax=Streptomyces sp. NPDC058623 TaxID=3346563 RepID=UPI00365665D5
MTAAVAAREAASPACQLLGPDTAYLHQVLRTWRTVGKGPLAGLNIRPTRSGTAGVRLNAVAGELAAWMAQQPPGALVVARHLDAARLYLAVSSTQRPRALVLLAQAVRVEPVDLCAVDRETLAHLRVFTGRSRAAMARELGMAEETYRQLDTTGNRGRLASSRYSYREERWVAEGVGTAEVRRRRRRLAAALRHTREDHPAERERRWQRLHQADPAFAARIEELGRLGRALQDGDEDLMGCAGAPGAWSSERPVHGIAAFYMTINVRYVASSIDYLMMHGVAMPVVGVTSWMWLCWCDHASTQSPIPP